MRPFSANSSDPKRFRRETDFPRPRWHWIVKMWDIRTGIVTEERFLSESGARSYAHSFMRSGGYDATVFPRRYRLSQRARGIVRYKGM
jgi:hypothetical protein